MSKLWALHPMYLDDKRLLREHQSAHGLLNAAIKKLGKTSTNRFYSFTGYLVWRHYLDACELRLRGMRHESFVERLWQQVPEARRLILYKYPDKDIIADIKALRPKMHKATSIGGSAGRAVIKGIPRELNELVVKVASAGFPKDVFFI